MRDDHDQHLGAVDFPQTHLQRIGSLGRPGLHHARKALGPQCGVSGRLAMSFCRASVLKPAIRS